VRSEWYYWEILKQEAEKHQRIQRSDAGERHPRFAHAFKWGPLFYSELLGKPRWLTDIALPGIIKENAVLHADYDKRHSGLLAILKGFLKNR
jgi:hypothetical protein